MTEREPLDVNRFREPPTLSAIDVAGRAGVPLEYAQRISRALGLPEVDPDAIEYDERDAAVFSALRLIIDQGFSEEDIIDVARTYGQALSAPLTQR